MGTTVPRQVVDLVEHFDRDHKVFLSPDYKQEQLRLGFANGLSLTGRRSNLGVWTSSDSRFLALRRSDSL